MGRGERGTFKNDQFIVFRKFQDESWHLIFTTHKKDGCKAIYVNAKGKSQDGPCVVRGLVQGCRAVLARVGTDQGKLGATGQQTVVLGWEA